MNKLRKIISAVILRLSSDKKLKKCCVKAVTLTLAVFLVMGSVCGYFAPFVNAAESTADYRNLSFELYPEGEDSEKTVTLNGMMPKDASAEAVDVADNFTGENGTTDISEDNPDAFLLAAYDITITDGENEYQPDEDKPVQVEITDPGLSEESDFEVWHIKDNGEKEKIQQFSVEDGKISFTATRHRGH